MTIHYHAGHNMPGYLPEGDVFVFESFEDAAEYIRDDLQYAADFLTETGLRKWATEYAPSYDQLANETGPEWGDVIDGYAYWIMPCSDKCEEYGYE